MRCALPMKCRSVLAVWARIFWGFETQGVVPDILVLGKPIGNAFPLAAVITTPEIAASFNNGMEFFSTFGGNPVACAAGLAVLDVLRDENLQHNALEVGTRWLAQLHGLQNTHALIGDVRGSGLFLGIDLVNDRSTRAPATEQAAYVVNRLRERGILAGTDGPHHNVIKLRPPLIFSDSDADLFTAALNEILHEDPAQSRRASHFSGPGSHANAKQFLQRFVQTVAANFLAVKYLAEISVPSFNADRTDSTPPQKRRRSRMLIKPSPTD